MPENTHESGSIRPGPRVNRLRPTLGRTLLLAAGIAIGRMTAGGDFDAPVQKISEFTEKTTTAVTAPYRFFVRESHRDSFHYTSMNRFCDTYQAEEGRIVLMPGTGELVEIDETSANAICRDDRVKRSESDTLYHKLITNQ